MWVQGYLRQGNPLVDCVCLAHWHFLYGALSPNLVRVSMLVYQLIKYNRIEKKVKQLKYEYDQTYTTTTHSTVKHSGGKKNSPRI